MSSLSGRLAESLDVMEEEMIAQEGPYVQVAGFCDTFIEDKRGVMSLIRMIDTLITEAQGVAPLSPGMNLIIMLKSGAARGRHELTITPKTPSERELPPLLFTVHFEGEEKGVNVAARMNMTLDEEGVYWFAVKIDNALITNVPLRVRYSRMVTGAQPPSP
jgi:hypothetical protein